MKDSSGNEIPLSWRMYSSFGSCSHAERQFFASLMTCYNMRFQHCTTKITLKSQRGVQRGRRKVGTSGTSFPLEITEGSKKAWAETYQLVSTVSPSSSASGVTVIKGRVRSPLDCGCSARIYPILKSENGPKTY